MVLIDIRSVGESLVPLRLLETVAVAVYLPEHGRIVTVDHAGCDAYHVAIFLVQCMDEEHASTFDGGPCEGNRREACIPGTRNISKWPGKALDDCLYSN